MLLFSRCVPAAGGEPSRGWRGGFARAAGWLCAGGGVPLRGLHCAVSPVAVLRNGGKVTVFHPIGVRLFPVASVFVRLLPSSACVDAPSLGQEA